MGAYYREWLLSEHLFTRKGCQDAGRVYIWADVDERTLETGRALAESLVPGCGLAIHSRANHATDPIFSGAGVPNPELSLKAVRDRLDSDSQKLLAEYGPALDALQFILTGGEAAARKLVELPAEIGVSIHGKSVELEGPFAAGSSLSEDLQLEYADGMQGKDLGWGRLNEDNLSRVLEIHALYADLIRRTPYVARARSSNLLEHVLRSIEQATTGKVVPGALGQPGDHVLILTGHDTNLSNISGALGLSWHLQGYQPNDAPPGGALVLSLWRGPDSGQYSLTTQYIAQTLDQMRNAIPLTISEPPAKQDVPIPGCETVSKGAGCSWQVFKTMVQQAVDPAFISIETSGSGTQ